MKRVSSIGLALLLFAMLLSGCGQSSTGTVNATNTDSGSAQSTLDTNAPAENTDDLFVWEGTVITDLTEKGMAAEELVIPDTATSIDSRAFAFAEMKKVTLGANVEELGKYSFEKCKNLEAIVFPNSLKKIGQGTFRSCEKLVTVTFSDGLVEIGKFAFSGTSFESITIPEGVTVMGEGAFNPCLNATSVYLPASLENIQLVTFGLHPTDATIYVKEGSWADTHFEEYVPIDMYTDELVYEKAYY